MKLKQFFMAVMAGAAVLVGCNKEEDLGPAKLEVSISEINFNSEENAQDVTFTATRDWMVTGIPEWLALSAESGTASTKEQTVRVSATANSGYTRTAELVFTIGFARGSVTVTQQGPAGERGNGSGTKDDPYTVAGIREITDALNAGEETSQKYYFYGTISKVSTSFADSGNYGNANFTIVNPENPGDGDFYVFQTYYLGGRQWKAGDIDVKEGDEVVIYGPVTKYVGSSGTTLETVGKGASHIVSLNGVTAEGDDTPGGGEGEAKGNGTLEDPYNPAGICAVAGALADNASTEASYYIKGKITKVQTSFAASGNYGNANFYIADSEDGTGEFYIFQTYYLGARQWKSGDTDVKEGDVVVVYGPVTKYVGSSGNPTLETVGKGASHIVSLNGVTADGDDTPGGGDEPGGEPAGGDWASNITWTSGSGGAYSETASINGTADVPLLKLGTSSAVGSSTLTLPEGSTFLRFYALSWNNKPATFVIKANGTEVATFKPAVNSDVANSAPYTINGVSDNDRYTVTFPATTTLTVETTDASNPRIILFAAIATTGEDPDEGKSEDPGTEDPGTDQPGDTPGGDTPGEAGEYTFDFSSAANLPSWPKEKGLNPSTHVYTLDGKDFTFEVGSNVYMNGYEGSDYLFLASKTAAAPVYLGLPAIPGARLSKVSIVTGSSASESAHALIASDKAGASAVKGGEDKLLNKKSGEFSWTLSDTEAGKVYYFVSTATNYNAQITKLVLTYTEGEGGDTPGTGDSGDDKPGDTPGEDNPGTDNPTSGDFTSNISWEGKESAYPDDKATVNGVADVPVLKLGTSSKLGKATLTLPAGSTQLTFYALSWKNAPSKLVFKAGDVEVGSVEPAANDTMTGNSPYTLTVTDNDKYTITFPATTTLTIETTGSNPRAVIFGAVASADGSGDTPGTGDSGDDKPGDTPSGSKTVTFDTSKLAAAPCDDVSVSMDDVISFANSSSYGSTVPTQLRIYKGKTLTVSAKSGYEITKIEFTCTASGTAQYGPGSFAEQSGYTYEGQIGTWEGASGSVVFTASANQVRISEMSVTYQAK